MVAGIVLSLILVLFIVFFMDVLISLTLLDSDDPLFYRMFTAHKRWNKIYQCNNCKRLSRAYQRRIYEEVSDERKCPHCESYMYIWETKVIKEEKWMNIHPDCLKIGFLECFKIHKTIKKIRENKKMIESQQFFEDYNNIEVDFSWIENLQKKHK